MVDLVTSKEDSVETNTQGPAETGMARLLLARQEFGNIAKNKDNPYFNSKYVDLAGVIEHTFPTLAQHDILVQQGLVQTEAEGFGFVLQTKIIDTTTQNIIDIMEYPIVCKDYKDPQKVGGALTYARRYSLLTILGLAAEDDDGNLAAQPAKEPKNVKTADTPAKPTKAQLSKQVKEKYGIEDAAGLLAATTKVFGKKGAVSSFNDLDTDQLATMLDDSAPAF